jgi:type I restriction enzyme S subunit
MNHQGFKGCVSPAYVVFKTKNELNPYFLQHYLKSDFGNHLINWYGNRGGVRNALRYDDLCNVDIPDMDIQRQNDLLLKLNLYKNILALLNSENENQTTYLTLLRQSILQEAIEGKLTETWRKKNPVRKDDPEYDAAALLENIKAEKQKMIEEGKIRKEKLQESITEHSVSIPDSWERPILGVISKQITDGTHQTPTYVKDGKVFLSAQNVKPFKFMPENHQFVSDFAFNEYRKNKIPEIGDLLIGRVGAGIGETAAIDKNIDFAFYVSLGLVKIFKELTLSKYLQ